MSRIGPLPRDRLIVSTVRLVVWFPGHNQAVPAEGQAWPERSGEQQALFNRVNKYLGYLLGRILAT